MILVNNKLNKCSNKNKRELVLNLVSELATASKVKFRLDTHKEHATLYLYLRRTARSQISDQFSFPKLLRGILTTEAEFICVQDIFCQSRKIEEVVKSNGRSK